MRSAYLARDHLALEFDGGDLVAARLSGHRQDGEPLDLPGPGKLAVRRLHGRADRGEDGGVIGQDAERRIAETVPRGDHPARPAVADPLQPPVSRQVRLRRGKMTGCRRPSARLRQGTCTAAVSPAAGHENAGLRAGRSAWRAE